MKKLFFMLAIAVVALVSCNDRPYNNNNGYANAQVVVNQPTVSVTPQVANLGDNLNLQALGELVKNSTSAQDIENKLNSPNSINNLDLDADGSVDYIKVTEYGSGNNRGFSFTVDLPNSQTQEIATIEVNKANDGGQMNIQGNQNLYGNNGFYQSHYSLSDLMIMNYLFSYHTPYFSPYRYGYYPSAYHSFRSVPYSSYNSRVVTTTKTTRITRSATPTTKSTLSSPNASKSSSLVSARAKTLAAPTSSQKSFGVTSASKSKPSTNGFKNSSTTSRPSSSYSSSSSRPSSSYSSSSSRPSSSYSSSSSRSSGFGSSSRSSSSSSRSSSGGRRSDERFKTNIQPLTNSLDNLMKLNAKTYDWKVNEFPKEQFPNVPQNGFIAQDVEKVFPNLVETRIDGYKQVDYLMLIPSLVEAVKTLKTMNDEQLKEINNLKAKINQQEMATGLTN